MSDCETKTAWRDMSIDERAEAIIRAKQLADEINGGDVDYDSPGFVTWRDLINDCDGSFRTAFARIKSSGA